MNMEEEMQEVWNMVSIMKEPILRSVPFSGSLPHASARACSGIATNRV
jgi:hypothetical protein